MTSERVSMPVDEWEQFKARLAEVQDKLSIALAANHDLRDERDSLQNRLADPCKTYDKNGRLLTICHRLAEAEALLREVGGPVEGVHVATPWRIPHAWVRKCDAFLASDSAPAVACKTCDGTGREPVMIAGEWGVEWGSVNCSTCKADQPPFPRAVKCDRCGLWLAPLAAHECASDRESAAP